MNTVHNERIKVAATALNNLGVGAIISGIVVPLVRGGTDNLTSAVIWTLIGLNFAWMAQVTLGRLRT